MLFISLALLAQSAPVDGDTAKAARQCARVYMAASVDKDPGDLRGFSQQLYLAMTVAKADGVTKDFLPRSIQAMAEAAAPAADPAPSAASCDTRFPLARATAPAKLPADPADRDIMCLGTASMLAGVANRMADKGDKTLAEDVMPQLGRFMQRFEAARKTRNIGGDREAMTDAMTVSFRASLDRGNLDSLYQSCKALSD